MGIDVIKNGKINFKLPCLLFIKLKLPTDVTNRFRVNEIIGITNALKPMMAISAVYEDPPPSPTEE